MHKVESWGQIPEKQLDIMKRRIFTGEKVMAVRNLIDAHAVLAKHRHPHEQMIYVISGECDIVIGEETRHMVPDMIALIPSDVDHIVTVTSDEPLDAIDIFAPIREDFLR